MANLKDDHIKWILDLDAGGLQKELTLISSKSNALIQDNIRLGKEIKEVTKQMNDAEKQMIKCSKAGDTSSNTYHNAAGTYREAKIELGDYQKRVEENTKTINLNNTQVQEVIRSMKLEDMTMGQLKTRAKELESQFINTSKAGSPVAYANLEKQLQATHSRMDQLNGKTKEVQSTFSLKGFAESALSGWTMVLAGAMKVGEFFTSMTDDALKAEKSIQQLGFANKTVAKGNTADLEALAKQAKELMGIFTHEEIETATKNMLDFGLSQKQVFTLMPNMVDAAAQSGKTLDELATAIDKGTKNGVLARSALGQLGISFKDTGSQAENFRLIQEGLAKFTGGNTEAMKSQWGQLSNLKVRWEEIKETVGNFFLKIMGPAVGIMTKAITETKSATESFNEQGKEVLHLQENIAPLLDRYDDLAKKSNKSASENSEMKRIIESVTSVMPGAITAVDNYGNAISISTGRAREFITTEEARLKVMNKSAIDENQKLLNQTEKDLSKSSQNITEITKTGTFQIMRSIQTSAGAYKYYYDKANLEEIKSEQERNKQLISDKIGYNAEIKRLNGESLKEQLTSELKNLTDNKNGDGDGSLAKAAAQKKKVDNAMKVLETQNFKDLADIKQQYLDGDITTEFDYNQKLLKRQEIYDETRKNKLKELFKTVTDPSLKLEIQNQIADINKKEIDRQVDQNNKLKKILLDADPVKAENTSYDDRLRELGLFGIKREDLTKEQLSVLEILETAHTKNLKDLTIKADEEKLRSLTQLQASGIKAIESAENTKLLMLKEALSRHLITQQEYDVEEKKLSVELAQSKLTLAEANLMAIQSVEFKNKEIQDKALRDAKNEIEVLKNALKQAGIDLTNITAKTGKDISAQMKSIFGNTFSNVGNLFSSFYRGLDKLKNGDLKSWKDWANAIGAIVEDALSVASQANNEYYQEKAAALEADKQRDLTAAGDSADGRAAVEANYAQKELDLKKAQSSADTSLKVDQALAAGALAIIQAYAQLGPIRGTIAAALIAEMTAIQISTIEKQNDAIQNTTLNKSVSSTSSTPAPVSTGSVQVNGLYDGGWDPVKDTGYTGDGGRFEPAGVLQSGKIKHKGEYVVAQPEMAIPGIASMVRKIESIRRQRTSSNPLPGDGLFDGGHDDSPAGNNAGLTLIVSDLISQVREMKATKIKAEINYHELKHVEKVVDDSYNLGKRS